MKREEKLRFLASGAARALMARPAGVLLALITHAALARMMGATAYGTFIYVYTWTFFLGQIARLGVDRSAVRFGTTFIAQRDFASLASLIHSSFRTASTAGICAALLLAVGLLCWPFRMAADLRECFLIGVAVVPLLATHNVFEGFAQAQKRIWQATVPEQVLRQPLIGIIAAILWKVDGENLSAPAAMAANALASGVTLAIDYLWYRAARPAELDAAPLAPFNREWFAYGLQMSAVNGIGIWLLQADLVLVGALLGVEYASPYSVAARLASLIAWTGVAANMVFGPVVVELADDQSRAQLQRYTTAVARGMAVLAIALACGLWIVHHLILSAFGRGFLDAGAPLAVLLIGNVARELCGPVFALTSLAGLHRQSLIVLSVTALVNLTLNLVLIGEFGMVGGALATALTVTGYSVALWALVRRHLGIDATLLARAT